MTDGKALVVGEVPVDNFHTQSYRLIHKVEAYIVCRRYSASDSLRITLYLLRMCSNDMVTGGNF